MILITLLVVLVGLLFACHRYTFTYWQRHRFPASLAGWFPFGNLADVFMGRSSIGLHMYDLYKDSAEPLLLGFYMLWRPTLLVKDAHLARRILVQDFNSFHDRGTYHNPKVDAMSGHMFHMTGAEWRNIRAKLTPSFTSGKLRGMMPSILLEGENLKAHLASKAAGSEVVKMKDLLDRYALNIIANVGFGLQVDTISDPTHEFVQIEKIVNGPGFMNSLRLIFGFLCPSVLYFLNTHSIALEARDYFMAMTEKTFEYRERNNIVRKDFAQLLLQLRHTGKVSEDGNWAIGNSNDNETGPKSSKTKQSTPGLTIEECAAQSFLFYLAGFDTSASALAYSLYELVRNPPLLKKLQCEIDETLSRHGDEITYDAIQEMKYMEMVICEAVRKYPTLPLLNRECTIDYNVPGTDLVIPKGTPIIISLMGIGRDEKYFPEPERFNPERFEEANKQYDEVAYFPFGEGPRMCIGLRLGKMIAKIGLVQLLRSYDFECVNDAEIEFHNFSVTMIPKGGVEIRVVERQHRQE